ncbi:MAG: GNAT family N-acetyltransferase, partial [Roseiflexaceae bacterium]
ATGVLPAYRGHGIAQHVKYASLEIAARLGVRDVCTWVESRNKSMLHINTQFGFAMLHDVHAISHIYEITLE